MAAFNNMPGGCCCCQCLLSESYAQWIEAAGDWTASGVIPTVYAKTSDSDARLVCNVTHDGWQRHTALATQQALGEWVRIGFQNADASDMLYIRWKLTKPAANYVHDVEMIEVDDSGSPTTLATVQWTGGTSLAVDGTRTFYLFYDPDNQLFELFYRGPYDGDSFINGPMRQSVTAVVDRAFVATETITAEVSFGGNYSATTLGYLYRKCLDKDDEKPEVVWDINTGWTPSGRLVHAHADRAPAEYEVTISGVTAGTGALGSNYNLLNTTFVLPYRLAFDYVYYNASFAPYSTLKIRLTIEWQRESYNVIGEEANRLRVRLQIRLGAEVSDWVEYLSGDCNYDWRSFDCDDYGYGYQNACDFDFLKQTANTFADFSNAVLSITPIP